MSAEGKKVAYTAKELAELLGVSERAAQIRAAKEAWPFEEQAGMEQYAQRPPDWGKHLEISCSS